MEFLNNLYDSEYFIYILIGIIGVLLILFFIVLLSGKKRKTDQTKVELMNEVTEKSAIADTVPVKDNSLDATKEFKPEDLAALQEKPEPVSTPEVVPVEEPTPVLEPIQPVEPVVTPVAPVEPTRQVEPTYNTSFDLNYSSPTKVEEEPVSPEPLAPSMSEEKVTFKVAPENDLPKLNTENKEL